jgi:tellurite resistance protein TehA-like permease
LRQRAGTVIFLDKISPNASTIQIVVLFASWASLVASIIAGLIVLLKTVTLRSFHPKAFNGQVFVHSKFSALNLMSPDALDKAAEISRHATTENFDAIGKADRQATSAAATCLTAFGMSMLCFLIYALVRVYGGE